MKIKINDKVKILSGKDRGKEAKIIQVFPKAGKIVAEGVNLIKRHLRAKGQNQQKGQIIELSAPISAGKAALICTKCGKATRVGYKLEAGKKVRVCRKCKEVID